MEELVLAIQSLEADHLIGGAVAVLFIRLFEMAKKSIRHKNGPAWGTVRAVFSLLSLHIHTPQDKSKET